MNIAPFSSLIGVAFFSVFALNAFGQNPILVKDVKPGPENAFERFRDPFRATTGNRIYFVTTNISNALPELWISDATDDGTSLLFDFSAAPQNDDPEEFTQIGGFFLFEANDGTTGRELWRTDPLTDLTIVLADIFPGEGDVQVGRPNNSSPSDLVRSGSNVFFRALFVNDNLELDVELFKSDGTTNGTRLVKDINPTQSPISSDRTSFPLYLTDVNGTLFFSATDGTDTGREIWKSNGSEEGTELVADILPPGAESDQVVPKWLIGFLGRLYFTVNVGDDGRELWVSDGSEGGTKLFVDINDGAESAFTIFGENPFLVSGSFLFLLADDGVNGRQLWRTDGDPLDTIRLTSLNSIGAWANVNGTLFFAGQTGSIWGLWKSNGSVNGTELVRQLGAGAIAEVTNVNGTVFFRYLNGDGVWELWMSDGTPDETVEIELTQPGEPPIEAIDPDSFFAGSSYLFFTAFSSGLGRELWAYRAPEPTKNASHFWGHYR